MPFVHRERRSLAFIQRSWGSLTILSTAKDSPLGNVAWAKVVHPTEKFLYLDSTVLYCVECGRGVIRVNNEEIPAKVGTCLTVQNHTEHQIIPEIGSTLEIFIVGSHQWPEDAFPVGADELSQHFFIPDVP